MGSQSRDVLCKYKPPKLFEIGWKHLLDHGEALDAELGILVLLDVVEAENYAFNDLFEATIESLESAEVEVSCIAYHAAILVEDA